MESDVFWLWEFIGRLHPLVVHFPIGLIVVAGLLELYASLRKKDALHQSTAPLIHIGAITALIAAIVGLLLANAGSYGGRVLDLHRWSGFVTALLSIATLILYRRAINVNTSHARMHYRAVLFLAILTLAFAGHQGASLTHGSGYLTEVLPWNQTEAPSDSETAEVLAAFSTIHAAEYTSAELDRLNLEVRAIFAHSCYRCHSTEKHEGDLILDNEDDVFRGGESGPVIVAGSASESELARRINLPRGHEDAMPEKGDMLTPAQIQLIERWIDLGAHWADQDLKIFPEAELALEKPEIPANAEYDNPIDRFVDAYFDEQHVRWPKVVDDHTYARRVYLDLVGLLPTPEEMDAFLENPSPNKRAALVDTLLAHNHDYTQHWLTFWNDLLRNDYSGTGYITGGRKQITRWLYTALEQNWSYDTMVRSLISPNQESEGFIRGIAWRGDVNNSQRIEMQAAQNISQSLLGLNLKCASCHNSFVSNLTLDQAYGFATIFADSSLEIFRCDKPTGRMSSPAFIYPELGTIDGDTVEERLVQLADAIVQPANGRLYRTLVNRYWDRLLGRGLVMPVDEMDNQPWSQDLLDWLAADFIEQGTDIKQLLRQITTSRAYQLASIPIQTERELTSPSFVFEGPTRRRLTAEQFADGMSQILGPVYHSVAFDPYDNSSNAEWIWYRERTVDRDVLPTPGKRYFRHVFTSASNAPVREASGLVAVDHSFTLFINGQRVTSGEDWTDVQRLDLSAALQAGENVIAVEGENEGKLPNPAGLLFSLKITFEDGSTQDVFSNQSWLSYKDTPDEGWQTLQYNDSAWSTVRRYGRFNRSYWNRLIAFNHDTESPRLDRARASLVTLDPFLKALGRPTRENVTTRRDDEATLLQALELTNGEFFYTALHEGAIAWLDAYQQDPTALVNSLYLQALGRLPSNKETEVALELLTETPTTDSVQDLLWAVFMLPEFQVIL